MDDAPPPSEEREPVLVSACLLGHRCRYDGSANPDGPLQRRLSAEGLRAVPCCPEEAGGLGTPRAPAWISSGDAGDVLSGRASVQTGEGADKTEGFLAGARHALRVCQQEGARRAFLKERSPSCGVRSTHVAGELVPGRGVTAELLAREGIEVEGVEGRQD